MSLTSCDSATIGTHRLIVVTSAADRVTLQVHVKICFACQRFVSQLNFMRRATSAWRKHGESDADDAKPD